MTKMMLAALALGAATAALAQAETVHRTTLQDQAGPTPERHSILVRTTVDKGGSVPSHTHPGIEMAYVLDGKAVVTIAGMPARRVGAGDSFSVAQGIVHSVVNAGDGPLTILSTYIVDRDKPVATMVKTP